MTMRTMKMAIQAPVGTVDVQYVITREPATTGETRGGQSRSSQGGNEQDASRTSLLLTIVGRDDKVLGKVAPPDGDAESGVDEARGVPAEALEEEEE